jgi:phosphoglycolate phosphatase
VSRIASVLFDLDGTLTDPFEGIAASIRHAVACMSAPAPGDDELRRAIGPPLRHAFRTLLGTDDPARIELALRHYRERYSTTGLFENRIYPGTIEMLADLNTAGCRLFVATSKPAVFARQIVEHFGLSPYFVRVYGSELDGQRDNKVDLLRFLLDSEHLDEAHTAMVGDRSHDMIAAKAYGLYAIGVTWGYGPPAELQQAGADVLCDAPADVVRAVVHD